MKKLLSLLLAMIFVLAALAGCGAEGGEASDTESAADTVAEEYTLPYEDGCNQITFYWNSDGADYSKCDMWIWFPNADGRGYLFHECEYGAKVVLNVPEDVKEVGFIVRRNCSDPGGTSWGDATKDYDGDRYADITGHDTAVYLKAGDGAIYLSNDGGKTLYQAKEFKMAGIVAFDKIKYTVSPATRITSLDQIKVKEGEREIEVKELSSLNNEVITGVLTLKEELDVTQAISV